MYLLESSLVEPSDLDIDKILLCLSLFNTINLINIFNLVYLLVTGKQSLLLAFSYCT